MIDPLRLGIEFNPPFSVSRPVFCSNCLHDKYGKHNPNVAIRYCSECPRKYLCQKCDEVCHDMTVGVPHSRRILVLGPGVRKKVLVRGDKVNFPLPLDDVTIKLSSRIYHEGKLIHQEPAKSLQYVAGLSGRTCHVQILGAGDLIAADNNGTSDPFVTAVYNGKNVHMTRIRQRTLNPRWNNESIIIPLNDSLPPSRNSLRSQQNLLKLEVYDYDTWNANDFLGHVEITKTKLEKLAIRAKNQPIRLPLSLREFHGLLGIKFGFKGSKFYIKIARGESLDKMDPFGLSDPYVKVYFGSKYLGIYFIVIFHFEYLK